MKRLNRKIADWLEDKARRHGIEAGIGRMTLVPLCMKDVKINFHGEQICIGTLQVSPRLNTFSGNGGEMRIRCRGLSWVAGSMADAPFSIGEELTGNIRLEKSSRGMTWKMTCEEPIKCLFQTKGLGDGKREFFLRVEQVSINRYKEWFGAHILSDFMRSVQSDTSLNLSCYYLYDPTAPYPQVKAGIEGDDLQIEPHDLTLSKTYLLEKLKEKKQVGAHYLPYESLPDSICRTIICTEDPSFYRHKGMCPVQLGLSLREAMAKRRWGRGGSTISMQLIKNALLNGERTLCRKLEEAILTLLMENYYRMEKKDILEIYLNMIELAPGVYGVEDGAQFYWGKSCADLNIMEVTVLTYIIPRPIHFYEALLLKTEQLQRNLGRHVRHYMEVALHKGITDRKSIEGMDMHCIRFAERFGDLILK